METIPSGVCAPIGFMAAGVCCGIKKGKAKRDLALILSDSPCKAAACYTKNLVKGAPILVTQEHLKKLAAHGAIVNSGNANTCNGPEGLAHAKAMARFAALRTGLRPEDFIVASTGVIGQRLPIETIEAGMDALVKDLSKDGAARAREAIMTTDTREKETAVEFILSGRTVRIGAMAKGSGMIHINMATMLSFITTDCSISGELLQEALSACVEKTFNCVSVDGDTSTNDMVCALANGRAGNQTIREKGPDYGAFLEALETVSEYLARAIAKDGEGATRLLECAVSGAADEASGRKLALSVISSSLVKAAFFGSDANWGRILCALGYSGVAFDPDKVDVAFRSAKGFIAVCSGGRPLPFDEAKAKDILSADEIGIEVKMAEGAATAKAWGCDLTYEYVKINGDYRS
jgi:glutamate N-acetyltransferase/amino-acid N-acetyltransferase